MLSTTKTEDLIKGIRKYKDYTLGKGQYLYSDIV